MLGGGSLRHRGSSSPGECKQSALGASLGPIIILRVFHWPVSAMQAGAMMAAGVATVFWWGASPYGDAVFKLLPGMLVPAAIYVISTIAARMTASPTAQSS